MGTASCGVFQGSNGKSDAAILRARRQYRWLSAERNWFFTLNPGHRADYLRQQKVRAVGADRAAQLRLGRDAQAADASADALIAASSAAIRRYRAKPRRRRVTGSRCARRPSPIMCGRPPVTFSNSPQLNPFQNEALHELAEARGGADFDVLFVRHWNERAGFPEKTAEVSYCVSTGDGGPGRIDAPMRPGGSR